MGSENPGLVVVTPGFCRTPSEFRQTVHPIFGLSKYGGWMRAALTVLSHLNLLLFSGRSLTLFTSSSHLPRLPEMVA